MQEQNFIMTDTFFFDSYALVEIFNGNKNFNAYLQSNMVFTKLNLFEVYHFFLKQNQENTAKSFLENFFPYARDYPKEVIALAAMMKHANNNRGLSMADCIGYCFSQLLGLKFLTGDMEFKDMDNVEFVK